MLTTKEKRKEKAIEIMKQLDIYKPYITGFKNNDKVCLFEGYGGYWVFQYPELEAKMKEIEKEFDCTVYAITHEYLEYGECYDFLIVSDYEEEWETLTEEVESKTHYAFSYVWNKTHNTCSEFGDILVRSFGGGIARVG